MYSNKYMNALLFSINTLQSVNAHLVYILSTLQINVNIYIYIYILNVQYSNKW